MDRPHWCRTSMNSIASDSISDALSRLRSKAHFRRVGPLLLAACLLAMISAGCGGQTPTADSPQHATPEAVNAQPSPTQLPSTQSPPATSPRHTPGSGTSPLPIAEDEQPPPVAFPQHDYPLGTDRGGDYYAGQLVLSEGCLRIDVPSNPNNAPWPSRLAIWPSSFSLEQDSGAVRVLDGEGRVAAQVGDHVRVSWAEIPYEEYERQELVTGMPEHCQPGLIFVGGDVTAFDPDNEATELRLSDPEVLLLRRETVMTAEQVFLEALGVGELVLDGPCLRIKDEHGANTVIWPAGFSPHVENGVVQVRNGAGQTIAQVGDDITGGGGYFKRSNKDCPGEAFHIHTIEVLPDVPVYFPQWDEEIKIGQVVKRRTGELTLDGKCLVIKNVLEGGSPDGMLPSWPESYGLNLQNGTVEVLDAAGRVVARVGDEVQVNAFVITYDQAKKHGGLDVIAFACPGAYWAVEEVLAAAETP